jgi:DNA polymerase elongation subunit (family B)
LGWLKWNDSWPTIFYQINYANGQKVVIMIWSQNQVMNSFKIQIPNFSILWFDIWYNGDYTKMKKKKDSQIPISYNF